jgi:hypothetical protein
MTEQQQDAQEDTLEEAGAIPAVPVRLGHDINTQAQGADFGSYMTYVTPAGADTARPILPFDGNRRAARIIVSAPGAAVAGSGVWVGTQAQTQAASPLGGFIPVGGTLLVEHNQAMWMVGDGANSLRVTVAQERWDSGTGQ